MAAPAAQPQQPQPLPEPEQPSTQQLDEDPSVQSAVRFLQDPRVKTSQVESQIRFLKGKNMSDAQIRHALAKVGRAVTAEKVSSVRAPPPVSAVSAMPPQSVGRPLSPVGMAATQPQYSQTLFPRAPRPPLEEETQTKSVDWRDVVIGTGAAIIASVAGYKLFNRYSPYEIRRKSERKPSRLLRGAGQQRLPYHGSSESEVDGSPYTPQQRIAPPLPPPPIATPPAAGPTAAAAAPGVDAEEMKKLRTQLDEAKEALTNERKKCADLAVGSAKIRAEKQQLSRANDRLTQQVESLKKDVEKLEAEKAAAGEGKLTATEEEPPKPFYPSLTVEGEQARAAEAPVPQATGLGDGNGAATVAAAMAAAAAAPVAEAPPAPSPAVVAAPPPAAAETVLPAAVEGVAPAVVPPVATAADVAAPAPVEAPVVAIPAAFLTPEPMKVDGAGVGAAN